MSKGFILKVLEAAQAQNSDLSDQIDVAKDMLLHGYDANDEQWTALNNKVGKLEQREPESSAKQSASGSGAQSGNVQGTKGHQQYVSSAQPGELGNQIGYPGTEQDQDGPGQKSKTVPGVKPPTKHDKK